ncbi:MAG: helix-turn-helix domain-containing protein [Hyphomonadaceae bacterium]|nr:helix-turn-helix domain-containing protein [Hyphomonadaceae bacterium]
MARPVQRTNDAGPRAKPRVDKEARKADYLRAAAKAFLAKGASASMQDVADAAGAPKPVFYRIFPSRADLIESFFQHIHDVMLHTQQGKWDGYGWALRVLYLEAKKEPEIFLVALKTFRGDPALEPLREKLLGVIHAQAAGFFQPAPGAPFGSADRVAKASKTISSLAFDTLVSWLEDSDGLSDEKRFVWYGRIIREWRKATREAYDLDPPEKTDKKS